MFQRDHIMRQIQQITQALASILFKKRAQQYDEALAEIDATGLLVTGYHLAEALDLTYDDLLAPLHTDAGTFDADRAALTAELLRLQGEVFREQQIPHRARASYQHALRLYLTLYLGGGAHQSPDTARRIRSILFEAPWRDLNPDVWPLLFQFFERTGAYADAEDVLFARTEHERTDALRTEGLAFYRRLRSRDPQLLREGNLPFDELGEGVRAFRAKF